MVPAISETIALSLFERAFKRLDFPALGLPAMTTDIPSETNEPWWALSLVFLTRLSKDSSSMLIFGSARKLISSSGKSIAAST